MTTFPDWFEEVLLGALGLSQADLRRDEMVEAVRTLNRGWVKGEGEVPADYGDAAALRLAYAAFYMPMNVPKLWFMLDRDAALVPEEGELRVCEVGCGPGTFLWATALWLSVHRPKVRLRAIGMDRSPEMLATAAVLAEAFGARLNLSFEAIEADWRQASLPTCDWLIFGNVLTEGEAIRPEAFVACLDATAGAAQTLILIEPGTQASFGQLRQVREAMAAAEMRCRFPCPSLDGACPMAADNWCHFHVNRLQLPLVQRVFAAAGRRNPRHHFCGFVFSRETTAPAADRWRALSRLRKEHRSGIRWLCDGCVMREVVLNRRARNDDNRPFLDADAGDLLTVSPTNSRARLQRNGRLQTTDQVHRTNV